jgi:nucleoid-associated protein YgaU
MIRMVLLGLGFIAITIMLVVLQPGASRRAAQPETFEPAVTRADPALVPAAVAEPRVQVAPQVPSMSRQVAAPRPSAGAMDDQSLRKMTWDTLSNLNHATGKETAPGQPGSLLHTIVRRSLNEAPVPTSPRSVTQRLAPASPELYVVQPGDSLVSIAQRVYGDVNMTGPLFAANQAILDRPDDLKPGQTLVLPSK